MYGSVFNKLWLMQVKQYGASSNYNKRWEGYDVLRGESTIYYPAILMMLIFLP